MPSAPSFADANRAWRGVRRFAASGPGSWIFARTADHLDRPVYRWTRGRHTLSSLVSGLPVVMLTTTGAKSGVPRTVPLLGIPDGDGVAVIASNFGQIHHPGWYYNLRAHPEAEIAVDGAHRRVRAVEVEGERRARIWEAGLTTYPGFAQYERRAAHRQITVFALDPA
jgi:deazaflavin-dependent oxidoreductase (nitroreductase family)